MSAECAITPAERETITTDRLNNNIPRWWHLWGAEMRVDEADRDHIHMRGCDASLMMANGTGPTKGQIHLVYEIRLHECTTPYVQMQRLYPFDVVQRMFAADEPNVRRHKMLDLFECTTFSVGYFIRQGNYLTLPYPRHHGNLDPNLSLYLTAGTRAAVASFLATGS